MLRRLMLFLAFAIATAFLTSVLLSSVAALRTWAEGPRLRGLASNLVLPLLSAWLCVLMAYAYGRTVWRRWRVGRRLTDYLDGAGPAHRAVVDAGVLRQCVGPWLMAAIGIFLILFGPMLLRYPASLQDAVAERATSLSLKTVNEIPGGAEALARIDDLRRLSKARWVSVGAGAAIVLLALGRVAARRAPWRTRVHFAFVDVMGHSEARVTHGPLVVDPELDRLKTLCEALAAGCGGFKLTWAGDGGLFAFPVSRWRPKGALAFAFFLKELTDHRAARSEAGFVPRCRVVLGFDEVRMFDAPEDWHSDEINQIAKSKSRRPVLVTTRAHKTFEWREPMRTAWLEGDGLYDVTDDAGAAARLFSTGSFRRAD